MPAPVVTVLLPARNAEATVARAVESLLGGSLRDIRVLAVDDGSTDGTCAVLQGLAARDARMELLEGRGRGLVAALQLALSHATSPYVARMDADDEALPRRLEASLEALEADSHLAGVGTGVELFRVNLLHAGYGLRDLPEVLFRWRDSAQRLTRTDARYAVRRFSWLKARSLGLGPLADGRPCTIWGAGRSGLTLHRLLGEFGVRAQRFVEVHPRKVGTYIHGIPVVSGEELGPPGQGLLLICVGVRWAREALRADLTARGWVEGVDFLCAA